MKGKLIVIEGPHGSGKTTLAKKLIKYYQTKHVPILYTKEPFLKEIKNIINKYININSILSAYILLYLHAADRIIHIKFIKEKINNGYIVISDRYCISSFVYQQIQGIPLEFIEKVNSFCVEPDVTFILDVPLNERKRRLELSNRIRKTIFFEEENLILEQFLYKNIYNKYKEKWKNIFLINGNKKMNEILEDVIKILNQVIYNNINQSN